jgi:uncharacterized membrane-anchored protein
MITEEKIKRIRKQLSKGEPEGEIKNGLRNDGLSEEEITALFYNLFPKKTESKKSGSTENSNAQLFYLIGACFIIAGGSMLAINTWLKQFGIPLIVLGGISLCVNFFIANGNKGK